MNWSNLKLPHLPFWAWTLGGVATIFGLNVAVTLPTYTTTKKEFCITCHQKQREAAFWEQSTLHPKINCSECHATGHALTPSINIFPLESGGEHAGFSAKLDQINPNCVRCHARVFDVERASPKINPYNVSIPHRFHVQKLKNACTTCHYNIYHDPHEPATFRPPKEACFECHRREKTSCSMCHPKGAIPLPETVEVSHSECSKCHRGFENAKIEIYGISFPHEKHIPRLLNCNVCHVSGKEHGKINRRTRRECLSCHHQPEAKCTDCHEPQTHFIRGEALGEKEPQPDVMAREVKCIQCHTTISQGHSLAEVKKACVECHDPQYGKMTDEWQQEVSGRVKKLRSSLESLRIEKTGAPESRKGAESLMKEVNEVIRVLDEDKSKGVHNFVYAQELMTKAEEKILAIRSSFVKASSE